MLVFSLLQSPGGVAPCPAPLLPPLPVLLWVELLECLLSVLPLQPSPAPLLSRLKDTVPMFYLFSKHHNQLAWDLNFLEYCPELNISATFTHESAVCHIFFSQNWLPLPLCLSSFPLLPAPPSPPSDSQSHREGALPRSWEDSHLPPSPAHPK